MYAVVQFDYFESIYFGAVGRDMVHANRRVCLSCDEIVSCGGVCAVRGTSERRDHHDHNQPVIGQAVRVSSRLLSQNTIDRFTPRNIM